MNVTELVRTGTLFRIPTQVSADVSASGLHSNLWPFAQYGAGRGVLSIGPAGIGVFTPDGEQTTPWSQITSVRVTAHDLTFRTGGHEELGRFSFLDRAHGPQITATLSALGIKVDLSECARPLQLPRREMSDVRASSLQPSRLQSTAHRPRSTAPRDRSASSRVADAPRYDTGGLLLRLFLAGIGFEVLSWILLGTASSLQGLQAAALCELLGGIALLISVIGGAVMLGVRAGNERRS